ncbi:MAG: class I SAM-dependent methyltransferase [Planctomycetales bacterium]|jgi:ubiquinone/menaquinone biosynthesis C-methylase UbiE|nr:class I SAM-dependent methyltransferase [Planctomycetales bacterium]
MNTRRWKEFSLSMTDILYSGFLWLCVFGDLSATEPIADPTVSENERYQFRKEHDPNGLGKFYMGREIARFMTFHGAAWLERVEREEEERLSELLKHIDLDRGMVVADVGAGSGVLTLMMAQKVGPEGKVLAVDIQKEMLDLLADKLSRNGVTNVDLVLGTEKSPQLKEASIDLALMVDVYHEFQFPYEMMLELAKALKPGGRIIFVEYRREDPQVPIKLVHKMSEKQVKKEVSPSEFGLMWKETIEKLPRQHIIIFQRLADNS